MNSKARISIYPAACAVAQLWTSVRNVLASNLAATSLILTTSFRVFT